MKKVTILKKGLTSKGGFWALVQYSTAGFICTGFVTPDSQESYDALTEGEEITLPVAAIRAA